MDHVKILLASVLFVVIGMHILGGVTLILAFLSDAVDLRILEGIFEDITSFFFIFSGEFPIGSAVVSIMLVIALFLYFDD